MPLEALPPRRPGRLCILALIALVWGCMLVGSGCATSPDETDENTPSVDAAPPGSPWEGLTPAEATEHFLERTIPYDGSNTYLIDNLAGSYEGDLADALARRLDQVDPNAAEPDLERFLLSRVGCRWVRRQDALAGAEPDPALLERRQRLLHSIDEAVGRIEHPTYRHWLWNLQEDRDCWRSIDDLGAQRSAASG